MKKIKAILLCYGKIAFEKEIEIEFNGEYYNAWIIEGIETKKELLRAYSKKQIILIYESGL